jgi:hypothetical protein
VKGQLFQTLMVKVFELRETRVLLFDLIGVAVAVKASSEVRIQLLVYMLVVMTVIVVFRKCRCFRGIAC